MKLKYIIGLMCISGLLCACDNDDENTDKRMFELSQTALDFQSKEDQKSFYIYNATGDIDVAVIAEESGWCTAELKTENEEKKVEVSVKENILVKSRTAKVAVTQNNETLTLIVRQSQKYFSEIKAVSNLSAKSGPGRVILSWDEPEDDNFGGVHITVMNQSGDIINQATIAKGVTTHTVPDLLSTEGEYIFQVQSYDYDREWGETIETYCSAGKKVAIRFKDVPEPVYVGYHFKASDETVSELWIGSMEFNENEQITISFDVDSDYLEEYNSTHGTNIQLMAEHTYSLPDFTYSGLKDFEKMTIQVNTSELQDRTIYGIPIRISAVSSSEIEEEESVALLMYHVDDLQGWYTVERLEKCGEGAGSYPPGARRYIKRTGEYTWETGYLFAYYSDSTDASGAGITNLQPITMDPETKKLKIQQGNYATSQDLNVFDPVKNELLIEYLYTDWSGWWTHERMFNRSYSK